MARIKIKDGGDYDRVMDYLAPVVSSVATSGTSTTVTATISSILETDIVFTQIESAATAAYIITIVPAAGTCTFTFNTAPGTGVLNYAIFHVNAA
jgi:hypothetical protein